MRITMMKRLSTILLLVFFAVASTSGLGQAPPSPPIVSPEVHADHSVTFRFRDPNAKSVLLAREGVEKPAPMQKDAQGVWSITTPPLEPDFYGYSFVADGVRLMDPSNSLIKPNLLFPQSMVHVPGPSSLPWEMNNVAHGVIHHHFYHSAVVGDDRDYYVYTPPGYNPGAGQLYPVLCLLHGYSDGADAWTAVGRANVILDNLIAQGKVKPMIVVMPLGYGAPEILRRNGLAPFHDPNLVKRNMDRFGEALLTEVMPQVEQDYQVSKDRNDRAIAGLSMGGAESLYVGLNHLDHFAWVGSFSAGGLGEDYQVSKDRNDRAIAGLSMGGAESLYVGLNHLDHFAWVGSFSAGGLGEDYNAEFPSLDSGANSQLHLLWIACGTDDRLIAPNRKFRAWLTSKGIRHTDIETPGMHTWMVWRRNLAAFAPLLFQSHTP